MPHAGAETAYLFRHALLRDAAYDVQLPSDRARLHHLALELTEGLFGGCPEEPALDAWGEKKYVPHPIDPVAAELARHARAAGNLAQARLRYLRRAAEYALKGMHGEEAARLWLEFADVCAAGDRAEALRRAAEAHMQSGDARQAQPLLVRALDQAREGGDAGRHVLALTSLGRVYTQTGQMQQAEKTHLEALELHVRAGNPRGEGSVLGNLAILRHQSGRQTEALELYNRALDIFTSIGELALQATTIGNLAAITQETGRPAEAEAMYARALEIVRRLGDKRMEGVLLGNLAVVYALTERIEQAEDTYLQSLAIHRETGNRRFEAIVLGNLGVRYWATGRLEASRSAFTVSILMLVEIGSRMMEGGHRCSYTQCLVALGQTDAALEQWRLGSAILRELGQSSELELRLTQMRKACASKGVPAFE